MSAKSDKTLQFPGVHQKPVQGPWQHGVHNPDKPPMVLGLTKPDPHPHVRPGEIPDKDGNVWVN